MEIAQPKIVKLKSFNGKIYKERSFPPIEVEMSVPSGKIVVMNDIREFWPEIDEYFDVNSTLGIKQTIEAYGKHGMFHGFVGNSCPGVWKSDDFYIIGNQGYDWHTDEITEHIEGEHVASICTDLWWYCIADLEDYLARGGEIHKDWCDIVDVTPGRYILKHYYAITNKEYHGSGSKEVFATFELSDEPINTYLMPEEPLYTEIPRILSEIHHFSHEYRGKNDEFSLLMSVRGGKHEPYEPRPGIPGYNWHSWWYSLGRLIRVKLPAKLVNAAHYDEIAVLVKKQSWAEKRRDLDHKILMRQLRRDRVKMSPKERKEHDRRAKELLENVLEKLKEASGK